MARPTIAVAISFTANASDVPVWQDVSSYVAAWSIRRGRSHESESFQAGQGTIVLDDALRSFDPTNTSSAYYPYVLPLRRVRIQATYSAVTYDIFYGYILSYDVSYPDAPAECTTTLQIADAFHVLALARVNATYAQQTTAARFTSILDAISWPPPTFRKKNHHTPRPTSASPRKMPTPAAAMVGVSLESPGKTLPGGAPRRQSAGPGPTKTFEARPA
jgi:hypothetical protein